jgi:hypothetical protein
MKHDPLRTQTNRNLTAFVEPERLKAPEGKSHNQDHYRSAAAMLKDRVVGQASVTYYIKRKLNV